MTTVHATIIFSTIAGCLIGHVVCGFAHRLEAARFASGVKRLLRSGARGSSPRLTTASLQNLWMLLNAFIEQTQTAAQDFPRVVEIGRELVSGADEVRNISRAVGKLLAEHSAPTPIAVAVIVQVSPETPPEIQYCSGITPGRTKEILLSLFHGLQDGRSSEARWGYWVPQKGSEFDFSIFGVGSVLCVPIATSAQLRGVIWMGFPVHRPALDQERMLFLHQVCDYCSSAFETAKKIQAQITDREKQRDFLVGMSHDLRAPGHSAMYALRDLLVDEFATLTAEQRLRLRIVEQCIEDQLEMLSDVLDFAKNQAGKLRAAKEMLRADEAIQRVIPWFRAQAEKRGIDLQVSSLPSAVVFVDPAHLKRILLNLFSNAVKYTDQGWVRVEMDALQNTVSIRVIDTGVGVPSEEESLLFRDFSRLSTSSGKTGSGLGLSISRTLAKLNGGTLEYRRRPGGGSIFELVFPQPEGMQSRPLDSASFKLQRVLVVEDDPAARRLNQRYLSDIAKNIFTAQSCREALSLVESEEPELIISDVHLGDESAVKVLEHLVTTSKRIPVLLLSGTGDRTCSLPFETDLPIRWLSKPADRSSLLSAITDFLTPAI